MYDYIVQPEYGSEFVSPVFGRPRFVRSDEWVVKTPSQLASQFGPEAFGRFNYVMRGAATENSLLGINLNFSTIATPLNLFFLLGVEYGVSAIWVGSLIITFMLAFELIYIISKKNRLLAATGACIIAFSPFFQWWSYVNYLTAGMGAIVCFYYFVTSENRINRMLFAFGIAVFASQFVIAGLYPAWQVPFGYLFLALVIWIIYENWEKVKNLDKLDYGIVGLMVVLIAAIIATYIWNLREYIETISNTVYPGDRHESGGGVGLSLIINRWVNGGVYGPISALRTVIYEPYRNPSEFGGMYSLFPVPVLFISLVMIRKRIVDIFSVILIVFSVFIGSYIYFGWPEWLARVTLMSQTIPRRAMDIGLFAQVLLFTRGLSVFTVKKGLEESTGNSHTTARGPMIGAIIVGAFLTFISVLFVGRTFIGSVTPLYFIITFIGFVVVTYSLFDFQRNQRVFKAACIYLICLSTVTVMTINPVMRGLDAIYSKPLSKKVSELADNTEEKWVSLIFEGPAFLFASGASTINSTNLYPNMELWQRLDPNREFEFVYNRYAHVSATLTHENTWFELLHYDWIMLHLSFNDFESAGVKYIHSHYPLDNHEEFNLTLLYDEGGSYIYKVS